VIDLYSWTTPNGRKIHIMLEETGLPYRAHPVNIGKGEQFDPEFLKISPNNKIPAIVDSEGPGGKPYTLFESGAILMYLAEKVGQFWPQDPAIKYRVVEWLMFQMGGIGPMFGQAHHFRQYAPEKIQYAIDRYTNEAKRLYGVMDKRLAEVPYLAGDYSIADMATFPWTQPHANQGVDLADYPNVKRWYDAIMARPAVQRGIKVLTKEAPQKPLDNEARENMFGAKQYQRR
jgi:GST-like protein